MTRKPIIALATSASLALCTVLLTTRALSQPEPVSLARVQPTSPGSPQTGHINITGTMTAGRLNVGGAAGGANLSVFSPMTAALVETTSGNGLVATTSSPNAPALVGVVSGAGGAINGGVYGLNYVTNSYGLLAFGRSGVFGFGPSTGWAGYFAGRAYIGGKVGIGVEEPTAPLHIVDGSFLAALFSTSSAIGTWVNIQNTSSGGREWSLISTGQNNGEGPGKLLVRDLTGVANRLVLDGATGFVGVSNNFPAAPLDVGGSIITSGAFGFSTVTSAPVGSTHIAAVAADTLAFVTSNIERARIMPDGRVGIGVTAPAAALEVGGSVYLSRALGFTGAFSAGDMPNYGIGLAGTSLAQVAGGAERMRVVANGRVGIGTTNPAARLHVADTGWPTVQFESTSTTGTWLRLLNTGASGREWTLISSSTGNGEGPGKLLFNDQSGGGTRMLIDATGNVGIGTNNPANRLQVVGTLTATTKLFTIDHPLDPANAVMRHATVESDEYLNLYRGKVVTDGKGYATVSVPAWFEALNKDVQHQLTVVDEEDSDRWVMAKVVRKLKNGSFTIRTSEPNAEVEWLLTGARNDAYARAHPLVVEEMKPREIRGRYLNPEEHGAPVDQGVSGESVRTVGGK